MKIMLYAYLDNNIGDDLMIRLLIQRFPEHEFYLYTDKSLVKYALGDLTNLVFRPADAWKQDMDFLDAHVSIGGSIFQALTKRQKLWRLKRLSKLSRLKGKGLTIATLGSNFGPLSGRLGLKLIEWEVRKNDLVTVRDKEALEMLEGFKRVRNFHLADDIVYELESEDPEEVAKRYGLGITAYRSIQPGEKNLEHYLALARIGDSFIKKTGKRVALLAFDCERENDLSAAHHIYRLAEEKAFMEIVPYLGDTKSFLAKFRACEKMIAIRFHGAILADMYQIPFLPVIYSNKMQNFLDDRAFEGKALKLSELDDKLETGSLADHMVDGKQLFTSFMAGQGNASLHFNELEKLLASSSKA